MKRLIETDLNPLIVLLAAIPKPIISLSIDITVNRSNGDQIV
jgi:hypothetical protein